MSRKVYAVLLTVMMILLLCACSGENGVDNDKNKIKIVTTIFPEYDWVREILGDKAEDVDLVWLLDDGVDMHSYQPSVDDVIDISTCDLFIYVGGESDSWVDSALKEAENKNMKVIKLLDVLGDKVWEEETPEGADGRNDIYGSYEIENELSVEESEYAELDDDSEYDEHVWLSLRNAEIFVNEITDALVDLDGDNAEYYKDNAESYIDRLSELDSAYKTLAESGEAKPLLFGDRFPFRYMVEDYGFDYYAAFEGCSSEIEASFETIAFLAGKLDEENLNAVFVTESSDESVAESIIENSSSANEKILVLDSLQSVTRSDVDEGVDYISLMSENLSVLEYYILNL